jgi:hypothetical protein
MAARAAARRGDGSVVWCGAVRLALVNYGSGARPPSGVDLYGLGLAHSVPGGGARWRRGRESAVRRARENSSSGSAAATTGKGVCVRQIFGRAAPAPAGGGGEATGHRHRRVRAALVGMEILACAWGGPMVGEIFILLFVAAILLS